MVYAPNKPTQPLSCAVSSVSAEFQAPEELYDALQDFLDTHPEWDYDRAIQNGLALFLIQNSSGTGCDRRASKAYLSSLGLGLGLSSAPEASSETSSEANSKVA